MHSHESHERVVIRCVGLVKSFAGLYAVNGLDLQVHAGECFGLLGPNGAGKTTTVEILEGLQQPDTGVVEILGACWGTHHDHRLREQLGIQLQESQVSDKLQVEEVIRLFRSFYSKGHSVDEVIAWLDLESKRRARAGKLSGGQKQRLALACALVSAPELLFLDEPTTGLDPQARIRVWEVVERYRAQGGTVLLTTHYMEEAARLCSRLAIIDGGKTIACGTPRELIAQLKANEILEFTTPTTLDTAALERLPGVDSVQHTTHLEKSGLASQRYIICAANMGELLAPLLNEVRQRGANITSLSTHQPTLEDVFVHLTGRALRDAS